MRCSPAHPRSRGEHYGVVGEGGDDPGSSPLARGALRRVDGTGTVTGLIPARAGSTGRRARGSAETSAHPRSRGEHEADAAKYAANVGSSPLARGAHRGGWGVMGWAGLIPARAGSTGSQRRCPGASWAHPRSRGEHLGDEATPDPGLGSSPLARGARLGGADAGADNGLIPARAGSTTVPDGVSRTSPAHPRSRGEHLPGPECRAAVAGSSPLARGAHGLQRVGHPRQRLIPARAGSTATCTPTSARRRAHPRSRGEHTWEAFTPLNRDGSSPLARGALPAAGGGRQGARLIPARAGSTPSRPPRWWRRPAHPRSRGEHLTPGTLDGNTAGSSPLARGALAPADDLGLLVGLIPARAGSTSASRWSRCPPRAHPRSRGEHEPLGCPST